MFSRRAAVGGGLAAPFFLRSRPSSAKDDFAACREQLLRLFPNSLDSARALGKACADGSTPDSLLDGLCATPDERRRIASAPLRELRVALDSRMRADFVHGRTRRVDGWVLSETETRLYAIIAA